MKLFAKQHWLTLAALLLSLPTAYLIVISILKYGLGVDAPFDSSAPWLERMGIKEPPGLNINGLILFGPIVACLFTVLQVLKIDWLFTHEHFHFHFAVRKRWFPILVGAFSLSLLVTLAFYLFGENCNCH
ncbi:MAG TPA: hypothetical protein VIZ28_14140 [Chitinophagaceae bacterium]